MLTLTPVAIAAENLPMPDPAFNGKIGIYYTSSEPDPDLLRPVEAEADAPNVLLVLIDDAGFGASSTFGGSIATPVLDRLAENGLRYNRFHTTALCSPTRAALLTGRNHHSVASGTIQELATGYPGYSGLIPQSTATIGQILRENGYSTACFGKNHNVPDNLTSSVGPFDRWPNGLGFDYFYGFIGGETDQWYPTLYENQNPVEQTVFPEQGYNLTHDLADKAIAWIRYEKSIAPERPFFAYVAPGAVHAPHQPPAKYVEKYKGKFDHGWDKEREIIFERQKKMGVIPAKTELTPRPEQMPAWDSFSPEDQKVLAREMETYAGFLEYTDYEMGRVMDAIADLEELDNTLIIYIVGDNGSSAEGSLIGTCNEMLNLNGLNLTMEDNRRCYDIWGGPETSPHFAVSWAWAMDTPFRWTKQVASYFGGTRNAMVVSWPEKIKEKNGLRDQFHHVIDIAPTLYEVAGIEAPRFHNGIPQKPIEGVSMAYSFESNGAKAEDARQTQYFEMFGHRALYDNGWMAAAFHNRVPWVTAGTVPFDQDQWELFNLDEDFSQAKDLSTEQPEKLEEMQAQFLLEGGKYGVFPLDDRFAERTDVTLRPSFTSGRDHFEFFPGMTNLSEGTAPNVKNLSHSIAADLVIPEQGAEGVILAMGGTTGGYTLFIKDGKLTYDYNWFDLERTAITSATEVPTGKVNVRFDFDYDGDGAGKGGKGTLFINNRKVAEERINKTVAGRFGVDTFGVGLDTQAPVSKAYKPPFKFTGEIEKVTIDIKS
ncbi:MAG: arylsulfatase [Oscillatoriales cyanobacterium RM1_1_9]|nr:arylsulfatase [Oscillatoriales cyanobacterium SM2_3_0]NJO45667.1 arylsulfatase [Oscillatoriales cyanobacterium RM2_1_1]NJO70539.1 arylsulfatase [Oscillatoriales cyanobacterium RM1_1_9]